MWKKGGEGGGKRWRRHVPLGSHHTEAFCIQEFGVQLSLQGSDHTHSVTDTNTHTHALHTCTHYLSLTHIHTSMHLCFGLCFELIPATGEAHRKLADNNIILWPSYGNMALLLWRNMNIMAFKGSLGNYMAVMLLSFNRIFWFSIYPMSLGGKSI